MESIELKGRLPGPNGAFRAKLLVFGLLVAAVAACGTGDIARVPASDTLGDELRIEAKAVDNQTIDARPSDDLRSARNLANLRAANEGIKDPLVTGRAASRTDARSLLAHRTRAAQDAVSRRRTDGALARTGTPRRIGRRDAKSGIFGFDEVRLGKSEVFRKWSDALQRHTTNRVSNTLLCAKGVLSLCRSEDMVSDFDASLLNLRRSVQHLPAVNHHVNKVSYVEDWANYHERDYWATPGEFFGNGGDCEDYAIAKYLLLRELGIDPNAMRIVVVMDQFRDTAHAVLAIYVGNDILVLDNLSRVIEPHELVDKYVPVYSLNENHAWLHTRPRAEIGLR